MQGLAGADALPRSGEDVPGWVGQVPAEIEVHKSGAVTISKRSR